MAQDWTRPSTRTEIIDQLVEGVDRYNPANVNILEDYLYHQIREREYDCLANLAILKLCEAKYTRLTNISLTLLFHAAISSTPNFILQMW
jgi:translation initiation factor 3 subunit K